MKIEGMNPTDIIDRYCQAWSDVDPNTRAGLLASVWSTTATYSDPTVLDLDADALLAHIGRIQASRPGAKVLRSTPLDAHHAFARFGFKVVGTDGNILREGIDVVLFSPDGTRIERIIGFFGSLSAQNDA
ncbi:MAG TPA: hypothetical protein VLJ57_22030 [Burkholderiaceae bacterium]|nr:hypothetical protein [Burkholderiaceae bacterium]